MDSELTEERLKVEEILETINEVNRRLEDLSIECRAKVSKVQWQTLEKSTSKKLRDQPELWQQTIFARTYFVDENLDRVFQAMLSCRKIFLDYLNSLNAILHGQRDSAAEKMIAYLDISSLHNEISSVQQPIEYQSEDTGEGNLFVRQSFTDLVRSKIDFDTKFLNFNTTLHKANITPLVDVTECQYEFCSSPDVTILEPPAKSNDDATSLECSQTSGTKRKRTQNVRKSKRSNRSAKARAIKRSLKSTPVNVDV